MHLCEWKKSFTKIPTPILKSEVTNINFWQIWHFDMKGTVWVGLELSIISIQTVGRFDMRVIPYPGTNIDRAEIFHV